MPTPFLGSEEYDERAHQLYDRGEYSRALAVLREALALYPNSVELYVGLGYTRLAREEFVWAKHAFDKALVLDPNHEDAMVGLGEALLRFGRHGEALRLFRHVREGGAGSDLEILLSIGRALYREHRFEMARKTFADAMSVHPESADAAAGLGYTLHRLRDERGAIRELRAALELDAEHHEARVYLGHVLYDRGEWSGALEAFEGVPPAAHWDVLAVWRLLELKRAVESAGNDPALVVWENRLQELEDAIDPVDDLLAELEASAAAEAAESDRAEAAVHRVRTLEGVVMEGTWVDIVRQLRDREGRPDESLTQFMERRAADTGVKNGIKLPTHDPEAFLLAHARAGLLDIER